VKAERRPRPDAEIVHIDVRPHELELSPQRRLAFTSCIQRQAQHVGEPRDQPFRTIHIFMDEPSEKLDRSEQKLRTQRHA
jgi:hypothetical protein